MQDLPRTSPPDQNWAGSLLMWSLVTKKGQTETLLTATTRCQCRVYVIYHFILHYLLTNLSLKLHYRCAQVFRGLIKQEKSSAGSVANLSHIYLACVCVGGGFIANVMRSCSQVYRFGGNASSLTSGSGLCGLDDLDTFGCHRRFIIFKF